MSTLEFLSQLRRLDIRLWAEGSKLHFSAPPAALTPDLRAELTRRKGEIVRLLHATYSITQSRQPAIAPVTRDGPPPASFAQQRLWFLDQWHPGNPAYNIPYALRIIGNLDTTRLQRALSEIARRHESLRTTFATIEEEGRPVQVIAPPASVPLPIIDMRYVPEPARRTRIWQTTTEEARRSFDLARGPLLRAALLHMDELDYVLFLNMHHTIADGWSLDILLNELATLYKADAPAASLPALPIQYADFAHWQRHWFQHTPPHEQLDYWQQRLSDLDVLNLPTDHPRPAVQTFAGAISHMALPAALTEKLKTLSQQQGATLFMTLLAAFHVLLHRYTGQTDITVGTPIANRTRSEQEGLIGCFVNTLVLRCDLSGDLSFLELLQQVREVALGAYAHQDVPFEQVVEMLQPERDLSRQPLFQVMFSLQNTPPPTMALRGMRVTPMQVHSGTAKFDLSLEMRETPQGLTGMWEYNTDLFDATTIAHMTGHFLNLLAGAATQPEQPIAKLPLLTAGERQQILVTWNRTDTDYPTDQCLHHLFEQQARRTPAAVAVVFEDSHLTYDELDRRANRLAHYLRAQGVQTGGLVGICVERSPEMVIALLGVLKAGAAYVPLDPAYPRERLAFMLRDSRTLVLLTQQHLVPQLPVHRADDCARLVCLDSDWETIAEESDEPPGSLVTPDNLAYVIYTSGSTGRPRGAMIPHRAICNHMHWMQQAFPLVETDSVLQKTPFSFDASVWEFYAPLLAGARLVMAQPGGHQDTAYLISTIIEQQITILQLVPTLLRLLLDAPDFARCTSLRRVFCGGEALPVELQQRFFEQFQQADLCNLYGPTEATIDTIFWVCRRERPLSEAVVPIGRPVANTRIYLLNSLQEPVPVGVPGEIYIGGANVGAGYLNQPDLTAERFISDPFSSQPDARLYRTGDLARYRVDGTIEFLGRVDHQVKIRGFRIEPGEIESALRQHPQVSRAAVIAREDQPGNRRLVAYVVLQDNGEWRMENGEWKTGSQSSILNSQFSILNSQELRRYLQGKLPEYMVPSAFVLLDELPLTPSGKLDRRALPAPDTTRPPEAAPYTAPRDQIERVLSDIWAAVLGIEQVGIHDNFFSLGGHSLQTMQLVARVSTELQCPIQVRTVFLHPTIDTLAREIERLQPRLAAAAEEHAPEAVPPAAAEPARRQEISYQPETAFLKVERSPLLSLFASSKIAPVEAAALSYLEPDDPLGERFRYEWSEGLPILREIAETSLGRVAIILLPRMRAELYQNRDDLIGAILEALELARQLGAITVSLAGLIPSATDYGQAIIPAMRRRRHLPLISTGHATTTATVVLSIKKILQEAGRSMPQERVGFLGVGSVGVASLRLMLRVLPHPEEILLCDLYSRHEALESVQQEISEKAGFRGTVRIIASQAEVPPDFYTATLIVGATNVPNILDVSQVQAGTLIVDDSAPHCFDPAQAIQRLQQQADILFTEGGVLQSPQPISRRRHLPRAADYVERPGDLEPFFKDNPQHITGCVFSALLSASFDDLKPTLGLVPIEASVQHYERLTWLGFQAAALHCGDYALSAGSLRRFRERPDAQGYADEV